MSRFAAEGDGQAGEGGGRSRSIADVGAPGRVEAGCLAHALGGRSIE